MDWMLTDIGLLSALRKLPLKHYFLIPQIHP